MYRISEFSKITNLTVKALRYYDEQGILRPSLRGENKYRFYSDADFRKAVMVALLRSLDFSIAEIREITENCQSPEDLPYYLSEKQAMIAAHIRQEKDLIARIGLHLQSQEKKAGSMNYQVEIREFAPAAVISVRFRGKYGDVGKHIGALYRAAKGDAAGAPFSCYYDGDYREEADIELCVPTRKPLVGGRGLTAKTLPKIRAVCVTHMGNYETLNLAYKTVLDYAREHRLNCGLPSRETYRKGPGMIFKGNPEKYVTEIAVPIEEE